MLSFARMKLAFVAAAAGSFLLGAGAALALSAADIEGASYQGGPLPSGQSAITAKVQLLLDRSGISPGVIDGIAGGMSNSAIAAFERRAGLPVDGVMDDVVWGLLQHFATSPVTQSYTITQADTENLVDAIPTDYAEKAEMAHLGYTSVQERLAERFHMDEGFISVMNPSASFTAGETISVMNPNARIRATVTRIVIEKEHNRVAAFDESGRMVVNYPATIGSAQTPSPSGEMKVANVAENPDYTYNPSVNFQQGDNDRVLRIPPGPNGPVGDTWIGLTKPTYGIHGTPTPSRLFRNESNGCVRLTNWDARELAHMVRPNQTEVVFLEQGSSMPDTAAPAIAEAPAAAEEPSAPAAASPAQEQAAAPAPATVDPLTEALNRAADDPVAVAPGAPAN
ncbi:MAG: L,D-transpeptidase [Paracoccus sp. (in: a-proteobacteria)]|nr:L,D-transpeptidase [Paracoccus sp. (in: a-proteobacteria)]